MQIPIQYALPLSILIAVLITSTHNIYLYWTAIVICSLVISIRHTDAVWNAGKDLISWIRKWMS